MQLGSCGPDVTLYEIVLFWSAHWIGLDPAGAPILLRDVSSEEIYALKLGIK
jgi:hypothetical protein